VGLGALALWLLAAGGLAAFAFLPQLRGGVDLRVDDHGSPVAGGEATISGSTSMPSVVRLRIADTDVDQRLPTGAGNRFVFAGVPVLPGTNHVELEASPRLGFPPWEGRASYDLLAELPVPDPVTTGAEVWPLLVVNGPDIAVAGQADRGDSVVLFVDGQHAAAAVADRSTGRFRAGVRLGPPGRHRVTAVAVDHSGAEAAPAELADVTYDPAFAGVSRQVSIRLDDTGLAVEATVRVPRSDSRVQALIAGRLSASGFLTALLPDLRAGGQPLLIEQGALTAIRLDAGFVEVRTDRRSRAIIPAQVAALDITGGGAFPLQPGDRLDLKMRDYRPTSYEPVPDSVDHDAAVWRGGSPPPSLPASVRVTVAHDQWSDPRVWPWLGFALPMPPPAWWLAINICLSLLVALPALAAAWWAARYGRDLPDPALARAVERLAVAGAATGFASPILEFAIYQAQTQPALVLLAQWATAASEQRALAMAWLATLLVLGVSAVPLWGLLQPVSDRQEVRWLWLATFVRALLGGVLLLMTMSATAAAASAVGLRPVGAVAFVVAMPVVVLLLLPLTAVVRDVWSSREAVVMFVLAGAAGSVAAALLGSTMATSEDLPGALKQLLEVASGLSPYLAAGGMLAVLHTLRGGDRGVTPGGPPARAAFAVLFCTVLVGAGRGFGVLPVGVLVSLALLRWVLVDATTESQLVAVSAAVRSRRRLCFERLMEQRQAEGMRDAIEADLRTRAGELANEDYLKRLQWAQRQVRATERRARLRVRGGGMVAIDRVVFAIGSGRDAWEDGLHAATAGLAIALVAFALALPIVVGDWIATERPQLPTVLLAAVSPLAHWPLAGFTFGYFFDLIRGWSGTLKGTRVALVIVASSALVWLTQTGFELDWPTIVGGPAITLVFYTFIGLWVFDRMALQQGGQSLTAFSRQGGVGRILKVISPFTASLALALFNALSGGLSSAAGEVLKGVVAQPGGGLPRP
jgi:hypothetical protein